MNWGKHVVFLNTKLDGSIGEALGSENTLHLDNRFGVARLVDEADAIAERNGHKRRGCVGYSIRQGSLDNYRILATRIWKA